MRLSAAERTSLYRARGWWRGVTVDSLLQAAVVARPQAMALADPPNREALIGSAPQQLSFEAIDRRVDGMARTFADLGLGRGDVLVTQLPNIVEGVLAFLACARMGAILSPLPMAWRAHEIRKVLAAVSPKLVLTVEAFQTYRHGEEIAQLIREAGLPAALLTVEDARLSASPDPTARFAAPADIDASELLTICWTSGTEADPKGVPRHHDHWVVNGEALAEAADIRPGDSLLNPFPLVNIAAIGGMVMPWLLAQGRLVQHHPFDLPVFLGQLTEERIAYSVVPPTILNMLLKRRELLEGADLSALRCLGSGSAPLARWMVEGWQQDYGIAIMNVFGSNEGCSLFSSGRDVPDPALRASYFPRFGVDGIAWSGTFPAKVRTRLVDPETETEISEPGQSGELRLDGAMVFDGYWQAPALTAQAFDADGWFRTGDLFQIADTPCRRFYQFVGRSKDVIIRGGINISPAELDDLVERHPAVREAACVGYPDPRLGERVCAVVALLPEQSLTLDQLVAHLKAIGISTYKLPEKLRIVEALPRNPLGKVLRRDLVEVARA